ncbi:hypothetical protein [Niabella drilacis]|uniref:Lipoprotein n=1 Tax=Niabella drilacis (strain DSM 25811 / CCM 8410 / CCUG 62505 / LMG 26954 / E90) TaxID=1285928 RepID=A0A1G7BIF2_NIADE|nr:hypothetical protein [Niabella drilacis]SDE26500.1 hypothetical protein SAMN04487894_1302 [Niabella drilacis]
MKFIFQLSVLLLLCGCTKSGTHKVIVENKSEYDIQTIIYNYSYQNPSKYEVADSFITKAGFETVIAKIFPEDYVTSCSPPYDSISIIVIGKSELKIKVNLNSGETYRYSRSGSRSKGYHVECRATITNTDIVPK